MATYNDNNTTTMEQEHSHLEAESLHYARDHARRVSSGQESINSVSGPRQDSSSVVNTEGRSFGFHWEGQDLRTRTNIHRSHISSSFQTGLLSF